MSGFIRWYNAKLAAQPLITNIITTGALFGIGDVIAQVTTTSNDEQQKSQWDVNRMSRAIIYGGLIFAPIGTNWYPLVSKITSASPLRQTLMRVTVDQGLFAPIVSVPLYFSAMGAMEGKNKDEIIAHVKSKYTDTLLANWSVWPAVQAANFSIVPVQYRLLVVNVVSIAWNAFLSLKNAGGQQ